MTDKEKIREEVVRMHNLLPIMDGDNISVNYADRICTTLEMYIDSMQEEPVKIKKGCKYRCLSDMINKDTGNISFIGDKIYLAPKDNTLVSEENGWLCDTSEDASNFELVEEPVSEDLEKACEQLAENARKHKAETSSPFFSQTDYKQGVIDGAKWQKEQMMAKAIDGVITFDYYGDDDKTYGCIAHDSFCLEDFGLKDRDEVKVIVIKKD